MFGYDVFNATSLINIPGAPATTTFRDILSGVPRSTGLGNNGGYTGPDGYVWANVDGEHNNGNANHLKNMQPAAINDFFKWAGGSDSGDYMILYPNDAFHIKGSNDTTSVYEVVFVTDPPRPNTKSYDYVVNIKKNGSSTGTSIPTACNSPSVPCFSNWVRDDANGLVKFQVKLQSASDYISIDVGVYGKQYGARDNVDGGIHAARFKTQCGTWSRHDDKEFHMMGYPSHTQKVQIRLLSVTKNEISGCTDSLANNYDSTATANTGCTFTTTSISSFAVTPTTAKVGDPLTLTWALADSKFSQVKIIHNGSDILAGTGKEQDQSSSITFTPTIVGSNSFKLEVLWNKTNADTRSQNKNVNIKSATSFIQCTDCNRTKDTNGECSDCKTGYFLDSTTGLCSQCSDPNRSKNTDGTCGDCIDRYELVADICQPIGGGNDCTDSNRETNADNSCASSCKSGYSFDSSNYCQTDSGTASTSSLPLMAILGGVGLLSILAIMA